MAQNNPLMFSGSAADMLKSMVRQKISARDAPFFEKCLKSVCTS